MNHILTQEKIQLTSSIPLTIAKIRGRYFVTGKMFKNLWVLTPCKEKARVESIGFPFNIVTTSGKKEINMISDAPIFEIIGNNLLVKDANNNFVFEYDIDSKKWINQTIKAGE